MEGVGSMTQEQRNQVANWLRRVGDGIRKDGSLYAEGTFTSRFTQAVVEKAAKAKK